MPPIKINTYDFNLSSTENLKANFLADRLAKNRWGKKFARLYTPHMNATDDHTVGTYDFTAGMRAAVGDVNTYTNDIADTIAFRDALEDTIRVQVDGTWGAGGALKHSYMAVLLESMPATTLSGVEKAEVKGIHFSLSIEGGVGRRTSYFHSSGSNDSTACILEPLENDTDDFGVYLHSSDLLAYGHYDGGLRSGTQHNTVLGLYGDEDRTNSAFATDQTQRFEAIWSDLLKYAKLMVEEDVPTVIGERVSVVIGVNQMLAYLEERISILTESIDTLENGQDRVSDDLALIDHLDISDTLNEEISDPSKIRRIWFKMEKEVSSNAVMQNSDGTYSVNPDYAWWEEEQFDEIREQIKDFQSLCVVDVSSGGFGAKVKVKEEVLTLSGHKIYWFVSAFLDVDVKVKKQSFFKRILNFLLLVVAIALVVISKNPIWLKTLLITTQILGYFGVLSPKIQLLVAVISFTYGVSNVNFSAMSGMQLFQWAFNNIDQIFKMVQMYDAIGVQAQLEKDAKEANKDKSMVQMQDEAMTFIYTEAYSQYDEMYNFMYDYEPKYLTS